MLSIKISANKSIITITILIWLIGTHGCNSPQKIQKNAALDAFNRGLYSTAEYEAIKAGDTSENW